MCRARCWSLSKYKYTCQHSWKTLPTHHARLSSLCQCLERGWGRGVPGTGWLRFTASAGYVPREPPAAHCRRDDTRGPPGWWGLPGSASQCWGSHTSTPHAAHSETSCTEEREEKDMQALLGATSFPSFPQPEVCRAATALQGGLLNLDRVPGGLAEMDSPSVGLERG